jgi:hypothetical protein
MIDQEITTISTPVENANKLFSAMLYKEDSHYRGPMMPDSGRVEFLANNLQLTESSDENVLNYLASCLQGNILPLSFANFRYDPREFKYVKSMTGIEKNAFSRPNQPFSKENIHHLETISQVVEIRGPRINRLSYAWGPDAPGSLHPIMNSLWGILEKSGYVLDQLTWDYHREGLGGKTKIHLAKSDDLLELQINTYEGQRDSWFDKYAKHIQDSLG